MKREMGSLFSELTALESYCRDRCINLMPAFEYETSSTCLPLHDFCEMLSVCLSYLSNFRYISSLLCQKKKPDVNNNYAAYDHLYIFRYIYFGPKATNYILSFAKTNGCFPQFPIPVNVCLILHMTNAIDEEVFSQVEIPFCYVQLHQCDNIWVSTFVYLTSYILLRYRKVMNYKE